MAAPGPDGGLRAAGADRAFPRPHLRPAAGPARRAGYVVLDIRRYGAQNQPGWWVTLG
jgi:hypothetical protein